MQRNILWVTWLANMIKVPTFPAQEGGSSSSNVWKQPIMKQDSSTDPLDLDPPKKTNTFDKRLHMNQRPCQHVICVCTRLTQAKLVTDRHTGTLLKCIQDMWIRPYGAPRVLESVQEGAFRSDILTSWLQRAGTTLTLKPKNTHTWMVEKHHDILRQLVLQFIPMHQSL